MLLWTVVPLDVVFKEADSTEPAVRCEEVGYAGGRVVVEKNSADQVRVIRVLSTDPREYLRQEWQPGTILSTAQFQKHIGGERL